MAGSPTPIAVQSGGDSISPLRPNRHPRCGQQESEDPKEKHQEKAGRQKEKH